MKKKSISWLSYLPIITLTLGGIVGFVRFQVQAENTKSKVEKLETDTKIEIDKVKSDLKEKEAKDKEDLEEVKKDNQEIDKSLTEMRVEQRYLQQSVIDLNNNVKELVQEIKEDRKKKK